MQVSVETGEGLQRRMTIAWPAEQIETELDKRLKDMARNVRLSGFRPGKVPLRLLRQRYQHQICHQIVSDLIPDALSQAMTDQGLSLAGSPHIEAEISPADRKYGVTASFEVLPELDLKDLSGQVIKRPVVEVTDADVELVIQQLREQRKSWQPVERSAQAGDQLVVDHVGEIDGEPLDEASGVDVELVLGSGRLLPGFEDGLTGAVAGEQRTIDATFPDNTQVAAARGRVVRFTVTVKSINEGVLPEVDEALIREFGVTEGTRERLDQILRDNLERERQQRIRARLKGQVLQALLNLHSFPIPDALVKKEVEALKAKAHEGLGGHAKVELPDRLFADNARRRVAIGLIVSEIVARHHIQVDTDLVLARIEELAASYESPQEVIKHYFGDKARLAGVQSMVLEEQVVDWLLQGATVEDETMTLTELVEATNAASGA